MEGFKNIVVSVSHFLFSAADGSAPHPVIGIILLCAVALSLVSCGGSSSVKAPAVPAEIAAQKKADRLNEAIMMNASLVPGGIQEGYLIGSEDLLDIEAHNVEELKKSVRVNSQGEIALPLVGVLHVKGLTSSEVEVLISRKLEKYVQETVVTVHVKEYKSQKISVVGAVRNPQIFSVTGQRYLLDMLLMAGGLDKEAGRICYVIRPSLRSAGSDRQSGTIVIDLEDLLLTGNFAQNIPVFAGDLINVPKGGIFFVDGAVRAPGSYPVGNRMTLVQALSLARGVDDTALLDEVRIFRENSKGEKDIVIADYGAMFKGEKPDMLIAENDIIIVPRSGLQVFFQKFFGTVGRFVSFGVSGQYNVFQ